LTLSAVPLAALIGGVAGGMFVAGNSHKAVAQETPRLSLQEKSTASSLESAFMSVADTVGPATVSIEVMGPRPARRMGGFPFDFFGDSDERGVPNPPSGDAPDVLLGTGSGLIVRPDGYILTNDHVVEGAAGGKVRVRLADGQSYEGKVSRDQQSDLAVVKIDAKKPLPTVKFADSDKLRVGQWAIAIGSPFGQQNSMTTGIVSALHRKSTIGMPGNSRLYPSLIQTDAAINRGNSGGPLLNINGELIGVNVAIFSPTGTSAGIGFAIPANNARFVADQLIAKGKVTRGFLGLAPEDLTELDRKRVGESVRGVVVRERSENTPAARAGIEPGDIITEFNGKPIGREYELRDAIALTPPGKNVAIKLLREGKPQVVTVTLAEAPPQLARQPGTLSSGGQQTSSLSRFGLTLGTIPPEQRKALSLSVGGVLIKSVAEDSPAEAAGLAAGMVITAIGGVRVDTPDAVEAALTKLKSGETVLVRTLHRSGSNNVAGARTLVVP
jgi:serine protease Do